MQMVTKSFTIVFLFLSQYMVAQDFAWARRMGGNSVDDYGNSIALDAAGNVYTSGFFTGTVDFDPGPGTFNLISGPIGSDVFISKLNASGNFVWARQLGGVEQDKGYSISVDASGNVYTTGTFKSTVDFNPGTGTFNLISAGSDDIFISKLNAAGNFVWARKIGGVSQDKSYSISVDAFGNVYTTGFFSGSVDFDPGSGMYNLTSEGSWDIFISKLDAAGNFVWARQIGGTSFDNGQAITTDASGNVYTTGIFRGNVDFDPGPGIFNLKSSSLNDIFISKLDALGNFVWAKQLGGIGLDESGNSIAVDAVGNVYTTGTFGSTADFDPGPDTFALSPVGSDDIFISKLDASGNFIWAKQMGGVSSDVGYSIVLDASGNVYTTGAFHSTADFDPGPDTFNLISAGGDDIFISKLDNSGNFVWARKMGGTSGDDGQAITVDTYGNVFTTGRFFGTVDFDPGEASFNLTSAGNWDIFVLKLSAQTTSIADISVIQGLKYYPNPSNGIIHIIAESSFNDVQLNVLNAMGQSVYHNRYTATKQIDLSLEGHAGLYYIEIVTKDKKAVLKVVKE